MSSDFPYDFAYDPPAPICRVTISSAATDRKIQLQAIVDSGADATIVPTSYLREISARRTFEAMLRSQWGERRVVFLYLVDLQIGPLTQPGVFVVGDNQGDEMILGRDVLNNLIVTLHGPRKLTQIGG